MLQLMELRAYLSRLVQCLVQQLVKRLGDVRLVQHYAAAVMLIGKNYEWTPLVFS